MRELDNDDNRWESLCKQCGCCCLEKLEDARGRIIYTGNACEYLDLESSRCSIYEQRFSINPICIKLTPELVPTLRWLPTECGYRHAPEKFTRKDRRLRAKRRN